MKESGVTIIGAGPAGMTAAFFLAKNKIPVTIIEKNSFPRDKICGDCIGGFGLSVLKQMDSGLFERFANSDKKVIGSGVHFFGPEHQKVTVRAENMISDTMTEVALCRRIDFDNFLFEELNKLGNINIIQRKQVTNLIKNPEGIDIVCSDKTTLRSKLLILATGSQHLLVNKLNGSRQPKKQMAAGIRVYYENISDLNPEGYIELHFLKELAPGYLWIFPLTGNQANVGLGLRSDIVSKRKIDLKQMLIKYIDTNPYFKERFENARQVSAISGYPLALGGQNKSISGNHYIQTGDSANLIEPLFGEGIGHAMYSGKFAAEHALRCLENNNFSAEFNKQYDREVYNKLGTTLKFSAMMQHIAQYPRLMSILFNRVTKNPDLQILLFNIINGQIPKKRWSGIGLIAKMIFNFK
jgi:geranylgeranyl reductase family protein